MMMLAGEYGCRAWERGGRFQGELERFVEDALQFRLCLNGDEGAGGGGGRDGGRRRQPQGVGWGEQQRRKEGVGREGRASIAEGEGQAAGEGPAEDPGLNSGSVH